MRRIEIYNGPVFKTLDVIRAVCEQAPQGITLDDVRRRVRILDKVDARDPAVSSVRLEDADWDMLRGILKTFRFASAHADLVRIADLIENAAQEQS